MLTNEFRLWHVPLFAVKYPAITDLPFHVAETAILRRYADETYHFKEQFVLQPALDNGRLTLTSRPPVCVIYR